jgi:hypothetical protein
LARAIFVRVGQFLACIAVYGWDRPSPGKETGQYAVAVTRDSTASDRFAQGSSTATGDGDRDEISVDLDLLKSKPGASFLSTTHEQDQESYYYPLKIKSPASGRAYSQLSWPPAVSASRFSVRSFIMTKKTGTKIST